VAAFAAKSIAVLSPLGKLVKASGVASKGEDGKPRRRYSKEILRTGVYKHPHAGWTADITPKTLAAFVAAFNAMRANGVDVEVTVDHSGSARDVVGYIVEMSVHGDSLVAVHELIGEDAFSLAETVHNTSVEIANDFCDGKGNRYGEAIVANSIVQSPVLPGQTPFQKLASARQAALALSRKHSIPLFEPEAPPMNELLLLIQAITGAQDVTEANAKEVLSAWWEKNKAKLAAEAPAPKPDADPKLSIDLDALEDRAEAFGQTIDSLVECGALTPDASKALSTALLGTAGARPVMSLSRGKGGAAPLARGVLDALKLNKLEQRNERSDALGRAKPAGGKPPAGNESMALSAEQHKSAWGY
jgi:hypothetical protein